MFVGKDGTPIREELIRDAIVCEDRMEPVSYTHLDVYKRQGVTGVEMEALTAVSIAALTVYDMCKAVQKDMVIDQIHLVSKSGGKSGDFVWRERK